MACPLQILQPLWKKVFLKKNIYIYMHGHRTQKHTKSNVPPNITHKERDQVLLRTLRPTECSTGSPSDQPLLRGPNHAAVPPQTCSPNMPFRPGHTLSICRKVSFLGFRPKKRDWRPKPGGVWGEPGCVVYLGEPPTLYLPYSRGSWGSLPILKRTHMTKHPFWATEFHLPGRM